MHTLRGKSFLLTTVYLYCLVHKIKVKAACPTGIAAANIEIEILTCVSDWLNEWQP